MLRTMVKPTLPAWLLAPISATERGASKWSRFRIVMIMVLHFSPEVGNGKMDDSSQAGLR
jgi:hypothetical protein